jgi:hypothetical protein
VSFLSQLLLHLRSEMLHSVLLQLRLFVEKVEGLVHSGFDVLSILFETFGIVRPPLFLFFREDLFSALGGKFCPKLGRDPCGRSI